MSDFDKSLWDHDKERLSINDRVIAEMILSYCLNDIESQPRQRASSSIKKSDYQTIFRTKNHKAFWLVLDFRKGEIELHFPDKDNRISGIYPFVARHASKKQGTQKREKIIRIMPGFIDFDLIKLQLDQIHSNANCWYDRTGDFSETLLRLFGEPKNSDPPLSVPSIEKFVSLLRDATCRVCKSHNSLNVCEIDQNEYGLFCDLHNPVQSIYVSTIFNAIPYEVMRLVWHRDGGKCVSCGSLNYITFDHMIPANRGANSFTGSHLETNIRLKCRSCNFSKGNKIIP